MELIWLPLFHVDLLEGFVQLRWCMYIYWPRPDLATDTVLMHVISSSMIAKCLSLAALYARFASLATWHLAGECSPTGQMKFKYLITI